MDADQAPQMSTEDFAGRAAVIITGGDGFDEAVISRLPDAAYLVAADGGLDAALSFGMRPDLVIGDFDSVSSNALDMTDAAISVFPTDKDETDLALAIEHVLERALDLVVIAGGAGQRLSHLLGNVAAITRAAALVAVRWEFGSTTAWIATPHRQIVVDGTPGEIVSLLPHGGPVHGIVTEGLRWPLSHETLDATTTRGVSNELDAETATVAVDQGALVVIHERLAS